MRISIHSVDGSGCNGFELWNDEMSGSLRAFIATNVFEDHLLDVLTERQFKRFESGEYVFTVPKNKLESALEAGRIRYKIYAS